MSGTAAELVINRNENANEHDLRSPFAFAQIASQTAVAINAATGTPTGLVFLRDSELSVAENSGTATARISRAGSLESEVTITYGITSDTAVAGQDFVGGNGTITMPANVAEVSVQIPIINDSLGEATETFAFSLINVVGANIWAPRTSRISILDDETPAPPPPVKPPLTSDYVVQQVPVVSGLNQPMRVEFSPLDARKAFVAEKGGVIKQVDITSGASSVLLDLSAQTNAHADRGLMDIALHPNFAQNPYLYAFVTIDPAQSATQSGNAGLDGAGNRYSHVIRYTLDATSNYQSVVPNSSVMLLGKTGNPSPTSAAGAHRISPIPPSAPPCPPNATSTGAPRRSRSSWTASSRII